MSKLTKIITIPLFGIIFVWSTVHTVKDFWKDHNENTFNKGVVYGRQTLSDSLISTSADCYSKQAVLALYPKQQGSTTALAAECLNVTVKK